ncbi:mCG1051013 [Mus musculus]|nr:mCG1051013 [Mus musculus]
MKPTTSSRLQHRASANRTSDSSKYSATMTRSKTESNQARPHWIKDEGLKSEETRLAGCL